jgi:uncharacterized protein (TIGR02217 family)
MARIDAVLDETVDYGFQGGPRYKVNVEEYPNGFEDRDSRWKWAKHEYSAAFGDVDDDQRDELIAAFHVCNGRKHSLKFKDWNDFKIVDQAIAVLPGTSDPIQAYKTYAPFGPAYTRIRPVQALKFAQLVDPLGNPVDGTWDLLTGIFTPTNEWGGGVYRIALAEFYVWVRYDNDYHEMTINSWRANTTRVQLKEDPFDFEPTNVPESWDV